GFASVAVDRLFDAMVILLLMAAAMLAPSFPTDATLAGKPVSVWAAPFAVALVVGLAGLYGLVFFPATLIRAYEAVARRVSPRLEAAGRDALIKFAEGL